MQRTLKSFHITLAVRLHYFMYVAIYEQIIFHTGHIFMSRLFFTHATSVYISRLTVFTYKPPWPRHTYQKIQLVIGLLRALLLVFVSKLKCRKAKPKTNTTEIKH